MAVNLSQVGQNFKTDVKIEGERVKTPLNP